MLSRCPQAPGPLCALSLLAAMHALAINACSGQGRDDVVVAPQVTEAVPTIADDWPTALVVPEHGFALVAIADQNGEVLPQALGDVATSVEANHDEPPVDYSGAGEWVDVEAWTWQWVPSGVIYHSYLAGPHEPRMALVSFYDSQDDGTFWDPTLGGRVGFLRYGNTDPLRPQGWELDFYGAAIARLNVEHRQDLDSVDYVFGFPLTYGVGEWQFKFGYAHLSSHLGDEIAIREPGILADRINYVRDSLVYGTSVYVRPYWRQYGEVGWAFNSDGGAKPWETQFGTELSKPGARTSTPFVAVNADLRQEHNFGGNLAAQTGWMWRGEYGQSLRLGLHFLNGKSSQYQFVNNSQQQTGVGIWYDF